MNHLSSQPKVSMYLKATCPYCIRAEGLLNAKGIMFIDKIRIDVEPQRRNEMITRTGRHTVPQIYIGDTYIGGCDDLYELESRGKLDLLLNGSGTTPSAVG